MLSLRVAFLCRKMPTRIKKVKTPITNSSKVMEYCASARHQACKASISSRPPNLIHLRLLVKGAYQFTIIKARVTGIVIAMNPLKESGLPSMDITRPPRRNCGK